MIYELIDKKPELKGEVFVANSADVIGDVVLNDGANVWFGAVIRGDVEKIIIGKNSNVQDNCTIHTDNGFPCTVGANVTVGHNVILHGCSIGDNTIVGMGSIILNGTNIAPNCMIGANSLVTSSIPYEEGVLILGSPAKVIRKLNEEEIQSLKKNAEHYTKNGEKFSKHLKEVKK